MNRLPKNSAGLAFTIAAVCMLAAGAALAQPARSPARIGVVNLDRLMQESPQAHKARTNMAKRFANRKDNLERKSKRLQDEIDRLENKSKNLGEAARDQLRSNIRRDKHQLQLEQSQYNDDVSDAQAKELDTMRSDLRRVIDSYAQNHGYDLILGSAVLYASDAIDVTDAILRRLKQDSDSQPNN